MSDQDGELVWGELEGDVPETACASPSPSSFAVEEDEYIDQLAPLTDAFSAGNRPASPAECPCCKASLGSGELSDCHKHVTQCFSQRHSQHHRHQQEDNHRLAITQQRIERIRNSVGQLMLHQRISLLESFGRLAHAAKHNKNIESGTSLSSKSREGDLMVMNLLFKPTTIMKRPNFAVDILRVNNKESLHALPPSAAEKSSHVPSFSSSSALSTSSKPDESPLIDRLNNSSTPDAPITNGRFRQAKRHRDVAQALQFSPQQPFFDGGPQTKQQKLQI